MTGSPDPRFLQANERTYLAWIRTGLAAGAAGLGIAALAPTTDPSWVRPVVAVTVTCFALVVLAWAVHRYRRVEAAILRDLPPPRLRYAALLAIGLGAVLVGSVIGLLLAT